MGTRALMSVIAAMVSLTLATGCSGESGDEEDAAGKHSASEPATIDRDQATIDPEWALDLPVFGQPRIVDDVATVLLKTRGNELDIAAVDAADGTLLWRRPASPTSQPAGIRLSPEAFEVGDRTYAAFVEPNSNLTSTNPSYGFGHVVVVDLRSGAEVGRSPEIYPYTSVERCESGPGVCFRRFDRGDRTPRPLRFDFIANALEQDRRAVPPDGRPIGDNLYEDGTRPQESLVWLDGAQQAWSVPVAQIFGPSRSTDGGWTFEGFDDVVVGSIGPRPTRAQLAGKPMRGTHELGEGDSVAGIDIATGERRWRIDGATRFCEPAMDTELPVACRSSGSVTYSDDGPKFEKAQVTLLGFDPLDGNIEWTVELSDDSSRSFLTGPDEDEASLGALRSGILALQTAGSTTVIDLNSGRQREAHADEQFPCALPAPTLVYRVVLYERRDGSPDERTGESLFTVCDATGKVLEGQPFTRASVREAGVEADAGRVVVATPDGLRGYDLS